MTHRNVDTGASARIRGPYLERRQNRRRSQDRRQPTGFFAKVFSVILSMLLNLLPSKPSSWMYALINKRKDVLSKIFVDTVENTLAYQQLKVHTGPLLVISNHFGSTGDCGALHAHFPDTQAFTLAKAEMFSNKFTNWFWRSMGARPITRLKPQSSEIREVYRAWQQNQIVLIFPEGSYTYACEHAHAPHYLTAPFEQGAATLAWGKKIPVLIAALAMVPGDKTGLRRVVRFETFVYSSNFKTCEEFHKYLESTMHASVLTLNNQSVT